MNEIIDYLQSLGFEHEEKEGGHVFLKAEGDPEYHRIFDFKCAQQHIETTENTFKYHYLTKAGVKKGIENAPQKDIVERISVKVNHYGSLLPIIKFYFETMPTQTLPE